MQGHRPALSKRSSHHFLFHVNMKLSELVLFSLTIILAYVGTSLQVIAADENTDASSLNLNKAAVYPLSCTNYKGMPLIKYELYDQYNSDQCTASKPVGTYVISLHRFMHSYWNYQALKLGNQFALPSDAAYLSYCLGTNHNVDGKKLYSKIVCAEKEKFASVKLRLHLYYDNLCTVPYDDGQSIQKRISNGYQVNGASVSTEVSFRPPFYSCESCSVTISDTFKRENWYDDDSQNEDNKKNNNNVADDKYLADDYVIKYAKHENRNLISVSVEEGTIELFEKQFSEQRSLANDYENWNLCTQLLLHGQWCDAKCQGTSFGSVSNWTSSSVSVFTTLAIIMITLMVIIYSKRVMAYEMSESLQDPNVPMFRGFPPIYVGFSYVIIIVTICCLGLLNMVQETIIAASIVTFILLVYLMKLTLFDSARVALIRKEKDDASRASRTTASRTYGHYRNEMFRDEGSCATASPSLYHGPNLI